MISARIKGLGLGLSLVLCGCTTTPWSTKDDLDVLREEINQQQQDNDRLFAKLEQIATHQEALMQAYEEHATSHTLPPPNESFAVSETKPVAEPAKVTPPEPVVAHTTSNKVWVGRREIINFPVLGAKFEARIDTGAESSSLDARDITQFERDGEKWVRFKILTDGKHEKTVERPVMRWVRVYQSIDTEGERRPVVQLAFRIGTIEDMTDFTLTDRSHLDYSVLVGRNILTDLMVVDVSESFLLGK